MGAWLLKKLEHVDYLTSDIFKLCIPRSYSLTERIVWDEFGIDGVSLYEFGKLKELALQYNLETEKEVKDIIKNLNLPKEYASIQFRGGDKILEQAHLMSVDEALQKLEVCGKKIENLFVFSDDYSYIEELREKTNYKIFALADPSERGYVNKDFNHLPWEKKRLQLLKMFAAIDICIKSNIHYGNEQTCVNNYIKSVKSPDRYYPIWLES